MAASVSFAPIAVAGGTTTVYTAPVANVFVTLINDQGTNILSWYNAGGTILAAAVLVKQGDHVVWGPLASGDVIRGCNTGQAGSGCVLAGEVHP